MHFTRKTCKTRTLLQIGAKHDKLNFQTSDIESLPFKSIAIDIVSLTSEFELFRDNSRRTIIFLNFREL